MELTVRPSSSRVVAFARPAINGTHVACREIQLRVGRKGRSHVERVARVLEMVVVGTLGLIPGCSFQDFDYLQKGQSGAAEAGGGGTVRTFESGGTASLSSQGTGGTTTGSASGGATSVGSEVEPDLPVLDCGSAPCADAAMIIDMEANDGYVCSTDGRAGTVSYFGDGTGKQWPTGVATKFSPLEACRGTSAVALHVKGTGFTSWGAGIAARFSSEGFDASTSSGILFWARSSTQTQITIGVVTPATLDVAYGGTCQPTGGKQCNDHFTTRRTLTPGWVAYPVSYSELAQSGWGVAAGTLTIDDTNLMELNIVAPQGAPFDYWLDDITFSL